MGGALLAGNPGALAGVACRKVEDWLGVTAPGGECWTRLLRPHRSRARAHPCRTAPGGRSSLTWSSMPRSPSVCSARTRSSSDSNMERSSPVTPEIDPRTLEQPDKATWQPGAVGGARHPVRGVPRRGDARAATQGDVRFLRRSRGHRRRRKPFPVRDHEAHGPQFPTRRRGDQCPLPSVRDRDGDRRLRGECRARARA